MGNDTSSMKIHSLLTADDLKDLRNAFPGGGASPTPVTSLNWGSWKSVWPEERRVLLEKLIRGDGNALSFQIYQDLAGRFVKGTTEERTKLIFKLMKDENVQTIKASELLNFMQDMADILTIIINPQKSSSSQNASSILTQSLMHELIFIGESRKACLHKKPESDPELDFDQIERWMVMSAPLFDKIMQHTLAFSFGLTMEPALVPKTGIQFGNTNDTTANNNSTKLEAMEVVFLNSALPHEYRTQWRMLFNSRIHGESFAKLSAAILNKGPNLLIVWEQGTNHIFGGFVKDSWKIGPKFYGSNQNFLFNLRPRAYVYETTSYNQNYQYMNVKAKTMPNGIGLGGQLDFFGLWIDAEYGKGKCALSCSSYQSPQLSKEETFQFDHVEVWGVGEEPRDEDDEDGPSRSALDLDPEAQAVMEMMGKTFVSKDVRAADEQDARNKEKEEQNDE